MTRSTKRKINPYIGRPFIECRDAMLEDAKCPYPRIQTTDGQIVFVDVKGLLMGNREICDAPSPNDLSAVAELLEIVPRVKQPTVNSYSLKGQIERAHLSPVADHLWNGAIIAGADQAGIAIAPIWGTLNANLGLSRRWYKAFVASIDRPRECEEWPRAGEPIFTLSELRGKWPHILNGSKRVYFDNAGLITGPRILEAKPNSFHVHKIKKLIETLPRTEQANAPIIDVQKFASATIQIEVSLGEAIAAAVELGINHAIDNNEFKVAIDLSK